MSQDPSEYAKKLQAELKSYEQALKEEFAHPDIDDPQVARKSLNILLNLTPQAGTTIKWLLEHAESETVRAGLAKFIFGVALKAGKVAADDDDITKMLKELANPSS